MRHVDTADSADATRIQESKGNRRGSVFRLPDEGHRATQSAFACNKCRKRSCKPALIHRVEGVTFGHPNDGRVRLLPTEDNAFTSSQRYSTRGAIPDTFHMQIRFALCPTYAPGSGTPRILSSWPYLGSFYGRWVLLCSARSFSFPSPITTLVLARRKPPVSPRREWRSVQQRSKLDVNRKPPTDTIIRKRTRERANRSNLPIQRLLAP